MSFQPVYIIFIIAATLITYITGLQITPDKTKAHKKAWIAICLILNFGMLFTFKYLGFFASSIQSVLDLFHSPLTLPTFKFLLPLGISFHTFQTTGYIIDVYKGKKDPEKHLGYYALFVSFFPQIIAGPIERAAHILPQFHTKQKFDYERIASGLRLAAWGMFKKIVISDRAAIIVDTIYNNAHAYSGANLAIATICFAFQIYCDFSGYTDIAIGCARVLGYDLSLNFNRPYAARSIADFWRRWHITLTSWFRDYIYIPLGGNRVKLARWALNIIIVFLISGLWHGAALTFIIWGALHGTWQVLGKLFAPLRAAVRHPVQALRARHGTSVACGTVSEKQSVRGRLITKFFSFTSWLWTFAFVTFAWIFFRANTVTDAFYVVRTIFTSWNFSWLDLYANNKLLILGVMIILMEIAQGWHSRLQKKERAFHSLNPIIRWGCYYALLLCIFLFAQYGSQVFIYFQF